MSTSDQSNILRKWYEDPLSPYIFLNLSFVCKTYGWEVKSINNILIIVLRNMHTTLFAYIHVSFPRVSTKSEKNLPRRQSFEFSCSNTAVTLKCD